MSYRAKRDKDGTYSIFGVPVFAEVPKGTKEAPFDIGKKWLDKALANARTRASEGYLSPLHYDHHDGSGTQQKAGHFVLKRVAKVSLLGAKKWALLADFSKLPQYAFECIMAGDWPYRSVEIASYEEAEIESIALLSDYSPFHKFELLNGESIRLDATDEADDLIVAGPAAAPVARFSKSGDHVLFQFKESPMKIVKIKYDPETGMFLWDGKPPTGLAKSTIAFTLPDGFQFMGDDEKDEGDMLPKDKKGLKKLAALCKAALSKFDDEDEDEDKHDFMDEDEDDENQHKPAEATAKAKHGVDLIAVYRRLDELEGDAKKERVTKRRDDALAVGIKSLTDEGYHLSDLTRAHFATLSPKGLTAAIKHYRACVTKDGPDNLEDDANDTDEVVGEYASQGDKAHQFAVEANKVYGELVEIGQRSGTEAEREMFVRTYMGQRGFAAKKTG